MAVIPKFFMDAVVAIGISKNDGTKQWIGTGFIVARKEENNPSLSTFYIVTNKHVVKNQNTIYIRFNSLADQSFVKDYEIALSDGTNKIYSMHPNEGTDIVVFQIIPQRLIDDKSIWSAFDLHTHALSLAEMESSGVTEGCLVYALGYPMNLVDIIKAPICRLGCISRINDAFIRKDEFPTFLVDAQTFPGNSGGPIVSRPEQMSIEGTISNNSANLIGILSAYIPYETPLINAQTNRIAMLLQENSGLTIVHPVDRIREVVEIEYNRTKSLTTIPVNSDTESEKKGQL